MKWNQTINICDYRSRVYIFPMISLSPSPDMVVQIGARPMVYYNSPCQWIRIKLGTINLAVTITWTLTWDSWIILRQIIVIILKLRLK